MSGSYLEEFRKGRTPRPTGGRAGARLMTDRDAYIGFLEVQLERVSAACLTAQSVSEHVDATNGAQTARTDAVAERVDALHAAVGELRHDVREELREAAAAAEERAAEDADEWRARFEALLATAEGLQESERAAVARADELEARVAALEAAQPDSEDDTEPGEPEPDDEEEEDEERGAEAGLLRTLIENMGEEQRDARERLRALEATAARLQLQQQEHRQEQQRLDSAPRPPDAIDALAAQTTELAEAVEALSDRVDAAATTTATAAAAADEDGDLREAVAALQRQVEAVSRKSSQSADSLRQTCVQLAEESLGRAETHNRRVFEALDVVEQQVLAQQAELPELAQRLDAKLEQRLACCAAQLEAVATSAADKVQRVEGSLRVLEQGQKALTNTVTLKAAMSSPRGSSPGGLAEVRAELVAQVRTLKTALMGHVDARVAEESGRIVAEGHRLSLEHEQRMAGVAALEERVTAGAQRIDSFLDLYNDSQVGMLARLQESAAQTARMERMLQSVSVDSAVFGGRPLKAASSSSVSSSVEADAPVSSSVEVGAPVPSASPRPLARKKHRKSAPAPPMAHADLHCAREVRKSGVPRQALSASSSSSRRTPLRRRPRR